MRPYNPLPLSRELSQQRRDICAGALEEDLGRGHDARRILPAQGLCLEGLGYEYKDALGLGLGCYCGVLSVSLSVRVIKGDMWKGGGVKGGGGCGRVDKGVGTYLLMSSAR